MATQLFCPNCGSKNEFINGRKPNFCSGCGHNFQSLAVFGGTPAKTERKTPTLDMCLDEDEHTDVEEAGISREDVEIKGAAAGNKVTIGSLFQNPLPPEPGRHNPGHSVKKANGKKVFEAFKMEAGFGGAKREELGE